MRSRGLMSRRDIAPQSVDHAPSGPTPGTVTLNEAARKWVVTAAVLGSGMASLDATVVNIALPALDRDLHAGFDGLQCTVSGYTLTLASLILLGGALGDRFGRRRIFVIGSVWFAVASGLCVLAPSIEVLVAARALQGAGAALLTPDVVGMFRAWLLGRHGPERQATVSTYLAGLLAFARFLSGRGLSGQGLTYDQVRGSGGHAAGGSRRQNRSLTTSATHRDACQIASSPGGTAQAGVAEHRRQRAAASHFPQPHRPLQPRAREQPSVSAQGDAIHRAAMRVQRGHRSLVVQPPDRMQPHSDQRRNIW
jgi:Major Facilitator Superfamily